MVLFVARAFVLSAYGLRFNVDELDEPPTGPPITPSEYKAVFWSFGLKQAWKADSRRWL